MSRYRVECPFCKEDYVVSGTLPFFCAHCGRPAEEYELTSLAERSKEQMEYTYSHPVDLLVVRNIGPTIASRTIGTIAFGLPAPAHKSSQRAANGLRATTKNNRYTERRKPPLPV